MSGELNYMNIAEGETLGFHCLAHPLNISLAYGSSSAASATFTNNPFFESIETPLALIAKGLLSYTQLLTTGIEKKSHYSHFDTAAFSSIYTGVTSAAGETAASAAASGASLSQNDMMCSALVPWQYFSTVGAISHGIGMSYSPITRSFGIGAGCSIGASVMATPHQPLSISCGTGIAYSANESSPRHNIGAGAGIGIGTELIPGIALSAGLGFGFGNATGSFAFAAKTSLSLTLGHSHTSASGVLADPESQNEPTPYSFYRKGSTFGTHSPFLQESTRKPIGVDRSKTFSY